MTSILVKALGDLLEVKDRKDTYGKNAWYEENQPKAWQQAREVLSLYSQSNGKTKEEILDGLNITTPLNELEGEEIYTRKEVLAAMEEYTQQFQSKENEGKQAVWVSGSDKKPQPVDKKKLNVKYKGEAELIVCLGGNWYWYEKSFIESLRYPVYDDSWSTIEWLDESIESGERGEVERLKGMLKEIVRLRSEATSTQELFPLLQYITNNLNDL